MRAGAIKARGRARTRVVDAFFFLLLFFTGNEETAEGIKSDFFFYGCGGRREGQLCVPPFNSGVGVWE